MTDAVVGEIPQGRSASTEERYDRIYHAGLALVCVTCVCITVYLASSTSLWLDEMFEVEYCREGSLLHIMFIDPFTPPLFNIIAWGWYRLVPFGELCLRLPSIAFVTAAIPFIAMTGRRLGGRRTGFIAAFIVLINAKVYSQYALTFRTYGLLFLLSAVLLYLFVRRLQTPAQEMSWGLSCAYAATMLALGYTHYFGILLSCAFFAVDVYQLVRGRLNGARLKAFVPYAAAVVLYAPWMWVALTTLTNVTGSENTWLGQRVQWQSTSANIHGLLYWLNGECAELLGFFHVSTIVVVVVGIYLCIKRQFDWREKLPVAAVMFAVWAVIGVVWVYATFVNTRSMFWVERYFTPLVPAMMVITAWGITKIFTWLPTVDSVRFVAAFLCVLVLVPTAIGTVQNDLAEGSSTRFYRQLTNYLEQRPDIEDEKTLVLAIVNTSDRGRNLSAWKHYYFDRKDSRDMHVNILDGLDPSVQLNPYDLLQYDTVYVTRQHFDPPLPDTYARVFKQYFKRHKTDNPGGGETMYYTKKPAAEQ